MVDKIYPWPLKYLLKPEIFDKDPGSELALEPVPILVPGTLALPRGPELAVQFIEQPRVFPTVLDALPV